jgi:N-acetylglucosamine malate deacetylase 1
MKFLGFDKVLCLSPHPDDVEYSMGGTILKCKDTQFDILTLTYGGDNDMTNVSNRQLEVHEFWSDISNANPTFIGNHKMKEYDEAGWVHLIENTTLTDHNAIVTPSSLDSHFEHRFVSNFGLALTRIRPISLLEYMSPSTQRDWIPSVYVDITQQYDKKLELLKTFKSQQQRSYFQNEQLKGFHIDFQCSKKGISLVEQFKLSQDFII